MISSRLAFPSQMSNSVSWHSISSNGDLVGPSLVVTTSYDSGIHYCHLLRCAYFFPFLRFSFFYFLQKKVCFDIWYNHNSRDTNTQPTFTLRQLTTNIHLEIHFGSQYRRILHLAIPYRDLGLQHPLPRCDRLWDVQDKWSYRSVFERSGPRAGLLCLRSGWENFRLAFVGWLVLSLCLMGWCGCGGWFADSGSDNGVENGRFFLVCCGFGGFFGWGGGVGWISWLFRGWLVFEEISPVDICWWKNCRFGLWFYNFMFEMNQRL